MLQNYLKSFGIRICLTSIDFPFMTCETPSMMIKRIDVHVDIIQAQNVVVLSMRS